MYVFYSLFSDSIRLKMVIQRFFNIANYYIGIKTIIYPLENYLSGPLFNASVVGSIVVCQ